MSDHFPTFSRWAHRLRRLVASGRRNVVGPCRALGRAVLTKRGLMVVIAFAALVLLILIEIRRREWAAALQATRVEMAQKHEMRAVWARDVAGRVVAGGWWANVGDTALRESRQAEFRSNFEQWASWHDERSRELWKMKEFDPEAEQGRDARQLEQERRVWAWMSQETARLQGKTIQTGYPAVRGPAILGEP